MCSGVGACHVPCPFDYFFADGAICNDFTVSILQIDLNSQLVFTSQFHLNGAGLRSLG